MKMRQTFLSIAMTALIAVSAFADGKEELQQYFNATAQKVKTASDPIEKRAILGHSFQTLSDAIQTVHASPLVSEHDAAVIDRFQSSLRDKQDELAGTNGFVRVSDDQLDAFADYSVQNLEQAEVISISLVTLLLIILLVILIVK